jgi:hypothetical protein
MENNRSSWFVTLAYQKHRRMQPIIDIKSRQIGGPLWVIDDHYSMTDESE